MKMQRRMEQRIRLVVEERRIALALRKDKATGPESTIELPARAMGRVPGDTL